MFIMQWLGDIEEEQLVVQLINESRTKQPTEEEDTEKIIEEEECSESSNVDIQLGIRLEIRCKLNLEQRSDHPSTCLEWQHNLSG